MGPGRATVYDHDERAEVQPFLPAAATSFLDVGCSTGAFGEALRRRYPAAQVVGVEPSGSAAAQARALGVYDEVVHAEFPTDLLAGRRFDCVVFNDVLEHLVDPWTALVRTRPHLTEHGVVVASIPSVQYLPVLVDLVRRSRFTYTDTGVLDRTHLRFFTWKSMGDMFLDTGYRVERIEGINSAFRWPPYRRFRALARLARSTQWMQFVVVARPAGDDPDR